MALVLNAYLSSDGIGITGFSLQDQFQVVVIGQFLGGLIPVEKHGHIHIIHYQVQITVVVQVAISGSI